MQCRVAQRRARGGRRERVGGRLGGPAPARCLGGAGRASRKPGTRARWDLAGLRPGVDAAVVRVATSRQPPRVRRASARPTGHWAWSPGPARETGSASLGPGVRELEGHGLYSYLLLGAPPGRRLKRYVQSIKAFWDVVLGRQGARGVRAAPRAERGPCARESRARGEVTAERILDNYDYARARSLLRDLPEPSATGRTWSRRSSRRGRRWQPVLFQDLSSVPPDLAASRGKSSSTRQRQ